MSTHNILSKIDIIDAGGLVDFVLVVGHIKQTIASLELRTASGVQTIAPSVQPETAYSLGSAARLLHGAVMFCSGQLADPGGGDTPFFAICNFLQGGVSVGSSDPLSGTLKPGEALVDFNFICKFV